MKAKKIELDVDFIGGEGALTVEEEKALSEFLKQRKADKKKNIAKKSEIIEQHKVNA